MSAQAVLLCTLLSCLLHPLFPPPGIRQLKSLRLDGFYLLPKLMNSLGRCTQLTTLALTRCCVAKGDSDLSWWSIAWPRQQLVRHLQGFAANLRKLTALQHLDLNLELDDGGYEDDEAGGAHP